ncbi:MAG: UDP-N-acetylmuramate dehydrogenase [Candidatus Lightella neohaematopini]|nr:UDP-N-acetylmuramate dehydrogenase [Candidatus Lightella neohaematopini]
MTISLKLINTFGLSAKTKFLIVINTEYDLFKLCKYLQKKNSYRLLILGNGSNVIFLENYHGIILLDRIYGLFFKEDKYFWYIHVNSGEIWSKLVYRCLKLNIFGLENLAMIPGRVGASVVQNIGAYGKELKDFCEYVDIIYFSNSCKIRLSNHDCKFNYRNSIFKQHLLNKCYIISLGLKISKFWQPKLYFNNLSKLNNLVTPKNIYDAVCKVRRYKLPDYRFVGNVGSFFKNPIVSISKLIKLKNYFPNIIYYDLNKDKKIISAAWLIKYCGLKGYKFGTVSIYNKHELILINNGYANSKDIIRLVCYILKKVKNYFSILLELEVCLVNKYGIVKDFKIFE